MPFVFLISSERSGGNLLLKLLDSHPEFCAPSPAQIVRTFAPNRLRYGDLSDEGNWNALCADVADFLENNPAGWRVHFDPRGLAKACTTRTLAGVIRHVFESEARAYGKVGVVDREDNAVRWVPFLLAGFADCRFVYLVRDPRDMALSFAQSPSHPGGILAGARRWTKDQTRALEACGYLMDGGRVHLLRYEDLLARTVETLGDLLNIHWPYKQPRTARNIRKTPFHDRFAQTGACFGAPAMAWERPLWFAREGEQPEVRYSYGEQSWWPNAEREALATRYAAALYELTPFAKFEVSGPDAEAQLQRLVAADLGVEAGRTVYGQMLNRHGGIEADVTVIRLAEDRFWMIGGAPTRIKDRTWLQRNMATGARADISDITEDYAVLGLMGPNARSILMRVSSADFSNDTFAFSTSQMIEIGGATVRANRLSFVGELGWELYIPNMHALPVYDRLSEAGKESGLIPAGLFSVDSCRLEKGFRHWSHDMGPEETPLEIGLGFAVAFNKGVDFIGRDALLRQREAGIEKRLVLFSVSDGEEVPLILHDEPVYRNGERVGQTTSGGRAFRVGGSLAFVMLHGPRGVSWDWIESGSYEIKVAGKMYNMLPLRRAPYDPDGKLLKN